MVQKKDSKVSHEILTKLINQGKTVQQIAELLQHGECVTRYWVNEARIKNCLECKCCRCGCHDPAVLDVYKQNYKDNSINYHTIRYWSWIRIEKEIASYVLLCRNCHTYLKNDGTTRIDSYAALPIAKSIQHDTTNDCEPSNNNNDSEYTDQVLSVVNSMVSNLNLYDISQIQPELFVAKIVMLASSIVNTVRDDAKNHGYIPKLS
jgi:hypothetical protein